VVYYNFILQLIPPKSLQILPHYSYPLHLVEVSESLLVVLYIQTRLDQGFLQLLTGFKRWLDSKQDDYMHVD